MNYTPTVTYRPTFELLARAFSLAGALGLLLCIVVIITLIFSGRPLLNSKLFPVLGYIAIGAAVVVSVAGVVMMNSSEYQAIQSQRNDNLVSNLKAKYLVTDVDFNMDDYHKFLQNDKGMSLYSGSSQEQTIIVSLKDNEKAVFLLTQDSNTSEPTLADLPFQTSKAFVADITRK